ncbi:PKD domain-containing protein [Flavicella marina]|uniref:PKD domain-containing protein n=1 Tax=Flavicella marina TaxID=1475951 RepID=UPI0012640A65|nr:PKD domain-containing protein [Flavicella marina]
MMTKAIKHLCKKGIIKFSFLISLSLLFSCNDDTSGEEEIIITPSPIAAFTETVDVLDYKTYMFTDRSTNVSTYAWDFGEGNVSTEEEPTHTFAQAGSYDVVLTVSNGSSNTTDTVEKTIVVTNPDAPVVGFTYVVDANDWKTIVFTNTSTNAVSYLWDFGDTTTSTDESPTKTFAGEGDYIVSLTATNDSGDTSVLEQTVSVVDPDPTVIPTFKAIILNGSIDEWVPGVYHKDDNNDAWELDPPGTFKNGQTSPYTWDNQALEESGSTKLKSAGITTTEHTGTHALKFSSPERRAYQPFAVEVGVEYTIRMFVRNESTDNFNVYILNNEVADETNLLGNSDAVLTISDDTNSYKEYSFTFTATTTTAVFYAVPFTGVSGTSEIYLDDISIETPGFD